MKSWFSEVGHLTSADYEQVVNFRTTINLANGSESDPINDFFDSLQQLKNVPLTHLIPDAAMLPMEALRIFYIDPSWITYMTDGANSIGRNSTKDQLHDEVIFDYVITDGTPVRMGFLLRSDIISGWPGLLAFCFQNNNNVDILRWEQLNDSTMICIAAGEFNKIILEQPNESIHFGFDTDLSTSRKMLQLKSLVPSRFGNDIPQKTDIIFRNQSAGVVDIAATADKISDILSSEKEASPYFSSLEFAVQMIDKRESITIQLKEEDKP